MKKHLTMIVLSLMFVYSSMAQIGTDTLYYDKNWKGIGVKAFASYIRIISDAEDNNLLKQYRTYYQTGELQSEGFYITIDKEDDSNSVFDGEFINYYKSGKVEQKGAWVKGKKEGEYTKYKEDGLIVWHGHYKDDQLSGVYTEFSDDGTCIQVEYLDGKPLYDYYMISNKDGFCSKVNLLTKEPIYESPILADMNIEYRNGEMWKCYVKNGIVICMTNKIIRDYGKYYQIPITITNNSMYAITFDPETITASLLDKRGNELTLKVFSSEEYLKIVRRRQNWAMAMTGFAQGMAAASAGFSASTTNTSYHGYSSNYQYGNRSYYGHAHSTTVSYNGFAAYQANVIASERMAAYENTLMLERTARDEGYLKKTTIYPGEAIMGYVNIERKKGHLMTINILINGAIYMYPWILDK